MLHLRYKILLPNMNTGIKAPEGMGIVVETADIQNYGTKTGSRWDWDQSQWFFMLPHIFKGRQQEGEIPSWRRRGGGWQRCWHEGGAMQMSDPGWVEQEIQRFWSRWNCQKGSWCTLWASAASGNKYIIWKCVFMTPFRKTLMCREYLYTGLKLLKLYWGKRRQCLSLKARLYIL